jgi:hypothetical protein
VPIKGAWEAWVGPDRTLPRVRSGLTTPFLRVSALSPAARAPGWGLPTPLTRYEGEPNSGQIDPHGRLS